MIPRPVHLTVLWHFQPFEITIICVQQQMPCEYLTSFPYSMNLMIIIIIIPTAKQEINLVWPNQFIYSNILHIEFSLFPCYVTEPSSTYKFVVHMLCLAFRFSRRSFRHDVISVYYMEICSSYGRWSKWKAIFGDHLWEFLWEFRLWRFDCIARNNEVEYLHISSAKSANVTHDRSKFSGHELFS